MRTEPVRRHLDEGFTLIEVLVALTVLTVAMTGLGAFFVNGSLTVAHQRDNRNAAVLAGNALEQIRALEEAALLDGRGQDKVTKQFQDAENGPFKDRLKPYFDQMAREGIAGATGGEGATLPTVPKPFTVSGTQFEQSIFVGPCEVYLDVSTDSSDDCVLPLAVGDPKRPQDATRILEYFRVVVLVSWTNKTCTANAGRCGHIKSALISKKPDDAAFSSKRGWPEIQPPFMRIFYRGLDRFQVKMNVRGGNLPNRWNAVALPDGLKIDSVTGIVSGIPTKVGTWTFATTGTYIRVVENEPPAGSVSARADQETGLTWQVVEPPALALAAPPKSYAGDPVAIKPTLTGGVGPFKYSISPALPAGLVLNATDGSITGTAGTAGTSYTGTITVTDDNAVTGTVTFTHTVYAPLALPAVASQAFPALSPVSFTIRAAGGDGTYTYSATGLPVGLAINPSTGVVSGASVTLAGRYLPAVTVTDGLGRKVTAAFTLDITTAGGLRFVTPNADVKTVRNQPATLAVTTNAAAVDAKGVRITTLSLLPPGVTWNTGLETFSGTPTVAGTYPITLTATSATPVGTMTFNFVWTVS
jgi:prepilin-type N-terminal cleavage/methylation domain-containing protein